jgi:hypothetical protein
VSYTFPSKLISRLGLSNARIFAQGINLLTWTKYTGLDPEVLFTEIGRYPQGKQYTMGLQIGF